MDKRELNIIISTVEGDMNLKNAEEYRRIAEIRILAEITRQVTRMADNHSTEAELIDRFDRVLNIIESQQKHCRAIEDRLTALEAK